MTSPTIATGHPIDLRVLLETRMLVQANSGGGKSWALRRLLEQTAPHVQQLIIDPEGEFATLREKFDYVIAAPHDGDALATPKTAALLARRLLESGVSAVLDIYDLKGHERQLFVRNFLEALINAPRSLWHPVLLALDEAHVYCPQIGKSESAGSVIDVATRGRKRGICLVAATQRLAKLHKDCAAELLNKLIGRTGLDVDVARAADELGLSPRQALEALRPMKAGDFYAFGPALSVAPELVTIGPVATTHPKPGERLMQAPPPASKKVLASLAKLADLQKDAEHEAHTIEELRASNTDLAHRLKLAEKRSAAAGVSEADVVKRIAAAVKDVTSAGANNIDTVNVDRIQRIGQLAQKIMIEVGGARALADVPYSSVRKDLQVSKTGPTAPKSQTGLTGPEQKILDAIAWMNAIGVERPEQTAVAFMAGYTIGGGAWNNPRGSLRTKGLIEYADGSLVMTDAGRQLARAPQINLDNAALHTAVFARLPGPERKLLTVLLESYPASVSNDELAARAGYAPKGGAFNNPRGRLRSLGLVEYRDGNVRARDILFPEKSNA